MEKITVYYNPDCSKCKKLRILLAHQDVEVTWVNYLENSLSKADLERILGKMAVQPSSLIRLSQDEIAGKAESEILELMVADPSLVNRPIVERESTAFLCRPLDMIAEKMPEYDWSEYL
ncbi:TPA: arsenate reductase family protein [Streptococcus suis]